VLKFKLAIILIIIPFFALAGNPPAILVSIKPIHSIIANITDQVASPELLLESNISPHSYALKPSDVKKIYNSDIVIYTSSNLESFINKSINNVKKDTIIIELVKIEGLTLFANRGKNMEFADGDDHDHDHRSSSFNIDPHIWLSQDNVVVIAKYISDILSKFDPDNSKKYKANLNSFIAKAKKNDILIKNKLSPYSTEAFIVYHDAYQYFEKNYLLNNVGHITSPSNITLGAKTLKQMKDIIQNHNVKCIFSEPQFSSKIVNNIGLYNNIMVGVLDPIGTKVKAGKDAYFDIIYNLATEFNDCLGKNDISK
jgi:zinc transport system substrate-binding protein